MARDLDAAAIAVVDDHEEVRASLGLMLQAAGHEALTYASAEAFLGAGPPQVACLIADVRMPDGMDGLDLMQELRRRGHWMPVIMVSGQGDIPQAVRAIRAGALDFIEKPYTERRMLDAVEEALAAPPASAPARPPPDPEALARIALLTRREHEVLLGLVAGKSNKAIGTELAISPRTVEVHRGRLMEKLGLRSLPDAVRLALAAGVAE